jgi:hypothetical protein
MNWMTSRASSPILEMSSRMRSDGLGIAINATKLVMHTRGIIFQVSVRNHRVDPKKIGKKDCMHFWISGFDRSPIITSLINAPTTTSPKTIIPPRAVVIDQLNIKPTTRPYHHEMAKDTYTTRTMLKPRMESMDAR